MTNYNIKEASSTSAGSAVIASALLILQLQFGAGFDYKSKVSAEPFPSVRIEEQSRTFGHYGPLFVEDFQDCMVGFEEAVASFYARLLSRQEPLGNVFERVLYDNLNALLVRT